jgi:hypothetical protein
MIIRCLGLFAFTEQDVATPNTQTADEQDDDEKVHELVDIITEEVSDVDRAANRRTYLVVKRSADMDEDTLGPELIEDEDSNLTAIGKAEDEEDDEDAQEAARRRKQALVLPGPVKQALLGATTGALRRLTTLVASIKDAEEMSGRVDKPMPGAVARELEGICDALAKLLDRYPAPMSKAGTQRQAADLLGTLELLQKLLAEALPQAPAAAPPAHATPTTKRAAAAPDGLQALTDALTSITTSMQALTDKVKGQDAEIARLKQSTGLPASREVDAVRAPKQPEPVSWPMDMNRPLTREHVEKDISFFDVD